MPPAANLQQMSTLQFLRLEMGWPGLALRTLPAALEAAPYDSFTFNGGGPGTLRIGCSLFQEGNQCDRKTRPRFSLAELPLDMRYN